MPKLLLDWAINLITIQFLRGISTTGFIIFLSDKHGGTASTNSIVVMVGFWLRG